jgi:hypothetical protein
MWVVPQQAAMGRKQMITKCSTTISNWFMNYLYSASHKKYSGRMSANGVRYRILDIHMVDNTDTISFIWKSIASMKTDLIIIPVEDIEVAALNCVAICPLDDHPYYIQVYSLWAHQLGRTRKIYDTLVNPLRCDHLPFRCRSSILCHALALHSINISTIIVMRNIHWGLSFSMVNHSSTYLT